MCKYARLDLQLLRPSELKAALEDPKLCPKCRMRLTSALLELQQNDDTADEQR